MRGKFTNAYLHRSMIAVLQFGLLGVWNTPVMAEGPLVLANGEWPPFFSEQLPHGGYGSRVCKAAFLLAGFDVEYEFLPWKRGYVGVVRGDYAGSPGWAKTAGREETFFYSDPILTEATYFYHRKDDVRPGSNDIDLKGRVVGLTSGYLTRDIIEPHVTASGGRISNAMTDVSNLKMLANGRIDIFPCSEKVFNFLAAEHLSPKERAQLVRPVEPFFVEHYYLIMSRTLPNAQIIIERFNTALRQLRESGLLDKFWKEALLYRRLPSL